MLGFQRLARACALAAAFAAVSAALAGFAGLAAAPAASAAVRLGQAPALPAGAKATGAVPAGTRMHVTVALEPRDPAGLTALAGAVSTPGSPQYRHYVTPAQFARRFGATAKTIRAVRASLRAHGLIPGRVSSNGLSIPVSATAGAVARAFSTSLAHAKLATGATAIVNRQAPALDPTIAPHVQAVLGLDTLSAARPLLVRAHSARANDRPHVVTGGPQPCPAAAAAAQAQGGYTADQIASAYGFAGLYGAADQAAGQTVAILELEPYDPGDIAAYQQCYGTAAAVSSIPIDGGAGAGPGAGEAALDIEDVIGLAPRANILVYEGPNAGTGPYDVFNAIISQRAARVVTASWGQCEALNDSRQATAENTLFKEAATQGQSILSASGDDGAEDCYPASLSPAVDDPASQPFITAVGGTSLAAPGPRPSERVWNDGPAVGAGGGGVSSVWQMPPYQANAPTSLHLIGPASSRSKCGAPAGSYCREVPDVSADADPATGYMIYWNGAGGAVGQPRGWQAVGGTSAAAPAWAALIALANASSQCRGVPIGFANPALYTAAALAYSSDFNDVTSGNNDMTALNGGRFSAGSAFDMATGLGSPNGSALAASLCADSVAVVNPGAQRSVLGNSVSLQIKALNSHGSALRYSAAGLPAGLSINHATGKITGHPRKIHTSMVTITAADAAGVTGRTSFRWTVQGAPALSRASLAGIGAARPRLAFTLAAGRNAPQLTALDIGLPHGLHFTRAHATVTLTGRGGRHPKFTAALQHGKLVLKLRSSANQLRVTIGYPRLAATSRGKTRMTFTIRITDAAKRTTRLQTKIRPGS